TRADRRDRGRRTTGAASASRRLRLLELFLAHLRDLLRRIRRHFLVHVKLRAIRATAMRDRVQRGGVAVELGFEHERLDLNLSPVGLGPEDLTAPRRQAAPP